MIKYILSLAVISLIVMAAVFLWPQLPEPAETKAATLLSTEDADVLAALVETLWQDGVAADQILGVKLEDAPKTVYVAARHGGKRVAHHWQVSANGLTALREGLMALKVKLPSRLSPAQVDRLEVVFTYDYKVVKSSRSGWLSNIHRGVRGIEISHKDKLERYSPTYMLSTNRDGRKLLSQFRSRHGINHQELWKEGVVRSFAAQQWWVRLKSGEVAAATATHMVRGNVVVPGEAVDAKTVTELAHLATDWLEANLQADGRMTYKYWPSVRQESSGNNMIRQWMATVATVRAAKHWGNDALMQAAAKNIDYNLSQFYREENGFGLIEHQNKVKLGAVALAALALAEHPSRQRWQGQEHAMQRTIESLWNEDGSFRTFYKPAHRNDVQNFYPGEALLYWATLYEENQDATLLKRILASYQYYRDWHLKPVNRNPAFTPWHTQAYFKVWKHTRDERLKSFIFEMNDWLVAEMQPVGNVSRYADIEGRFYNPKRAYGPPHASSTGVYMEGLIDAFELARAVGDEVRVARYRKSILKGLRSTMQLQFVDDVDMFYVPSDERKRVLGGIRTTVYNNEIRCDNVQHSLMAVLKIVKGFSAEDYLH